MKPAPLFATKFYILATRAHLCRADRLRQGHDDYLVISIETVR